MGTQSAPFLGFEPYGSPKNLLGRDSMEQPNCSQFIQHMLQEINHQNEALYLLTLRWEAIRKLLGRKQINHFILLS